MAWIKKVYLYLVSLVSLVILIIAGIMLINMALKTWVLGPINIGLEGMMTFGAFAA